MDQQQTGVRITGCHEPANRLKVPARLLSRPSYGARGESLKMENATWLRVTTVAASMPRPLFYKYRLHPGFEKIEIQSVFWRTGSRVARLSGVRRRLAVGFTRHARSNDDGIEGCRRTQKEDAESSFGKK